MANTLSALIVTLGLDASGFTTGLDKAEKDGSSFGEKIGKGLSSIGGAVVGTIGAAGAATGAFLASTVKPASDLNETMSKVEVVFGEQSDAVLAFGDNAANALGMSKNAALGAAATYGNLFRSMGMNEKTSADMSTNLVGLAGDLASFNNMDPTEVMDALRSGLSGETEPLKRLGVNINQAMLEQKALTMGIWDGVAPIDAAAKAQATYALVMEQTKLAQGDFARTSDGVANQQRMMAANFEDIKAKIGSALLPMLSSLSQTLLKMFADPKFQAGLASFITGVSSFANFVITNIPVVITAFQNLGAWFTDNQGVIVAVLAALGVAVIAFGISSAVAAAAAMAPFLPAIAIIALVGLAVYGLYQIWTKNMGGIQEKVGAAWEAIKATFNTVKDAIIVIWNTFMSVFNPLVEAFRAAFAGDWYTFGEKLREAWDAAWKAIGTILSGAWTNLKTIAKNLIDNIINFFTKPPGMSWGDVGLNIIKGIANGIKGAVGWITDAAKSAAKAALNAAKGFLGINSPSKVFEMQVGMQMGAGMMNGFMKYVDSANINSSLASLVTVPNMSQINTPVGSAGEKNIVINIQNPKKETSEESVKKTLKNLSYLGVMQ